MVNLNLSARSSASKSVFAMYMYNSVWTYQDRTGTHLLSNAGPASTVALLQHVKSVIRMVVAYAVLS